MSANWNSQIKSGAIPETGQRALAFNNYKRELSKVSIHRQSRNDRKNIFKRIRSAEPARNQGVKLRYFLKNKKSQLNIKQNPL
ncbi:MAG: hypothetical protein ACO1O1_12865 [Adhaeribacter sp.]